MAEEHNNDWGARNDDQPTQPAYDAHQDTSSSPAEGQTGMTADMRAASNAVNDTDAPARNDDTVAPVAPHDEQPAQPVVPAAPAAEPTADQATVQMPPAYDTPNYASAAGETTVVSSGTQGTPNTPNTQAGAGATGGFESSYRPAPEYGAYGPTPTNESTPAQSADQSQPTQRFGGLFGQPGQQPGQTGHNPFDNPFFTGAQQPGQQSQPFGANQQSNQQGNQNQQHQQYSPFGTPFPGAGQGQPGQPGQRPAKPRSKVASGVATAVVAALVTGALCLGVGYAAISQGWVRVPTSSSMANISSNQSGSGSATAKSGEAVDWTAVANEVSDSVVAIQTVLSNGTAKGSGAILDTEGHIITNNHVISDAQQIQVTLANGTIYSAQVVGTDSTTDLAVIKLDNAPSDLKAVEFADSDTLAVGENVMAIGNPLGYDDTATTGIVSALNRPVTVTGEDGSSVVTNAVQIDAAINPGNSGGPTFNAAGQVIGINSSIASTATSSDSIGSIGIGFAIPSTLVKRVANEIIDNGSVKHVALGVTIKSATVEADGVTRGGAAVTTSSGGTAVVSGGPADKAGIKEGDVIVAFNGKAVNNTYSLLGYVRAAALGDSATLTLVRDGKTMDVDVTLDQEEEAVNGTTSSGNSQNQQNQQNNGGGDSSQNGNGNSGNGNNQYGDGGGLYDPFGLW